MDGLNRVYGTDYTGEDMFFVVAKAPKYSNIFYIKLDDTHPAAKHCMLVPGGLHKRSSKPRNYTVNLKSERITQMCWTKKCSEKPHKGKAVVQEEEEDESSDDESLPMPIASTANTSQFTANKNKRRLKGGANNKWGETNSGRKKTGEQRKCRQQK